MNNSRRPAPRRPRSTLAPTAHVLIRLEREWQRLRHDPAALARARTWGLIDSPVDDLDVVAAAVGRGQRVDPACNERLQRLVAIAASDDLAARVVLQRLLPHLSVLARGAGRGAGHPLTLAALEDLVAEAWTVIRTFNPDRRPAVMAAALTVDCRDRVWRRGSRRVWTVEYVPAATLERSISKPVTDPDPVDEVAQLLAEARQCGLTEDDEQLLRGYYLDGGSAKELARSLRISERAVRYRREAAVARLRQLLAA